MKNIYRYIGSKVKMKKIIKYNPMISSLNLGDSIIVDSINNELGKIFDNNFIVDISSHLPVNYIFTQLLQNADYKFVCGSNLLSGKLNNPFSKQWGISFWNAKKLGPAVLVGAGWQRYNDNPNCYTKAVYKKILSKEYNHSVRDEYTERQLRKCGIKNVIVTACPTMWKFTPDFCKQVNVKKANNVVTTLTDYNKNIESDRKFINTLLENYDKVYFWVQGYNDNEYIDEITDSSKIVKIAPSLKAYDDVLNYDDIEFVGTRLHAGIRAIQHKKRSLIVSIDNRAKELNKTCNINIIDRENIDSLKEYVYSDIKTEIRIPTEQIELWKGQFEEFKL